MSETLSQEPLAGQLGEALQRADSRATRDAIEAMRQRAGQLSEPQRQALSRALQRAANVGRADSRSSNALRDAARAIAAGEQPDAQMQEASTSLEQAMQAAAADAAYRAAGQRLQDVRQEMSQVAQGYPPSTEEPMTGAPGQSAFNPSLSGTAVPIDASALRRSGAAGEGLSEPGSAQRIPGGGVSGADLSQAESATAPPTTTPFSSRSRCAAHRDPTAKSSVSTPRAAGITSTAPRCRPRCASSCDSTSQTSKVTR